MHNVLQRINRTARRHPRLALKLYAHLEQQAAEKKNTEVRLDTLYQRYFTLERLGEAGTGPLPHELEVALQEAETHKLPRQAGRLLEALGRIHFAAGEYRGAAGCWTRCIDMHDLTGDRESLVEARIGLAQIHDAMGDWEGGARLHRMAGELLNGLDHPYLACKQAINIGVNQMSNAEPKAALANFQRALALAEGAGIDEYIAESYWRMGHLALLQGELDRAGLLTRDAQHRAVRARYSWLNCASVDTLAKVLIRQNRHQEAFRAYEEGLASALAMGAKPQQANFFSAMSRLAEERGDIELALSYARKHAALEAELAQLSTMDRFRELQQYDLSQQPPVEKLLDLSSDPLISRGELLPALEHVVSSALEILRIEAVVVWLKDDADDRTLCRSVLGPARMRLTAGAVLSPQQSPLYCRLLASLHEPLVVHDVRLHPAAIEVRELLEGSEARSLLEVPLRRLGNNVGLICFIQNSKQRIWNREDVLFASYIANLVEQVLVSRQHVNTRRSLEQSKDELIMRLSAMGREIIGSLDRDQIILTLHQHIDKLMEVNLFGIGLVNQAAGLLEFPFNMDHGRRLKFYARKLDEPNQLAIWCIRERREILINDLDAEMTRYIEPSGVELISMAHAEPAHTSTRPCSMIYVPLVIKDRVLGVLSVQAMRKNAYRQVEVDMMQTLATYVSVALDNASAYRQLKEAQEQLITQEKLAALGSLVAGIAHELNTPIGNGLLTATSLVAICGEFAGKVEQNSLKRSELTQFAETARDASILLERNLHSAADLVTSFKQVAVDQTSAQRRVFNLQRTSQEVIATVMSQIRRHGHTIEVDIADDIELDSYPGPYGQVLANFINNALLHAFDTAGSGKISLSARMLPENGAAVRQVRIRFRDNGKGVPEEHQKRIFDPFFTTKLGQGGSGLGLNIVYNIVTSLLGGQVSVQSTVGEGTSFLMDLPLVAPPRAMRD